MKIVQANIEEKAEEIRHIFLQYYQELLKIDVCFRDFEKELENLQEYYEYPNGDLLLAVEREKVMGCVALRKVNQNICEMKRLFVYPEYRGQGLGRMLSQEIINKAKHGGYQHMRLDTLDWLKEAIGLYQSLGFNEIPPYLKESKVKLVYLGLELRGD